MGLYGHNGKENGNYYNRLYTGIEFGVYGDLFIIYPKPYSICLRGIIAGERRTEVQYWNPTLFGIGAGGVKGLVSYFI